MQLPAEPPTRDRISNRLKGLRVLVVDDLQELRDLLAVLLRRAGAEVRTADGTLAALAAIESEKPDLVLTDLGMPDLDGFALLDLVRHLPGEGRDIRMIALTGFTGLHERCLAAGFQDHLDKPVDLGQLFDAIQRVVRARPGFVPAVDPVRRSDATAKAG
jgi:CheY-like chemotaxis protein